MSLDGQITNMLDAIPECVAVGVVDIQTGMLLGIETIDAHPREMLDLLAATTGDLFQGQNAVAIEAVFKKMRGSSDNHQYFQEIIIFSDNLIHLFQRAKTNEDIVVVVVSRTAANLGMVLAKTRSAMPALEAAI